MGNASVKYENKFAILRKKVFCERSYAFDIIIYAGNVNDQSGFCNFME